MPALPAMRIPHLDQRFLLANQADYRLRQSGGEFIKRSNCEAVLLSIMGLVLVTRHSARRSIRTESNSVVIDGARVTRHPGPIPVVSKLTTCLVLDFCDFLL